MIFNSKEILNNARINNIAIPQFNINNLEWTKYILEECNKNNSPVILGISEKVISYMGGLNTVVSLIRNLDKELQIEIPVIIHLDHGKSVDICKQAINAGFTSVMLDASSYELEKNIEMTKEVVEYAHERHIPVEAELGAIGGENSNIEEAIKFVQMTNIDSFAPSIGNSHGIYKKKPNINYELCEELKEKIEIPLVLHGASGLEKKELEKLIKLGFCKININTELQIEWSNALKKYLKKNKKTYDPRTIISSGEVEIKNKIKEKIEILNSNKTQINK